MAQKLVTLGIKTHAGMFKELFEEQNADKFNTNNLATSHLSRKASWADSWVIHVSKIFSEKWQRISVVLCFLMKMPAEYHWWINYELNRP